MVRGAPPPLPLPGPLGPRSESESLNGPALPFMLVCFLSRCNIVLIELLVSFGVKRILHSILERWLFMVQYYSVQYALVVWMMHEGSVMCLNSHLSLERLTIIFLHIIALGYWILSEKGYKCFMSTCIIYVSHPVNRWIGSYE